MAVPGRFLVLKETPGSRLKGAWTRQAELPWSPGTPHHPLQTTTKRAACRRVWDRLVSQTKSTQPIRKLV